MPPVTPISSVPPVYTPPKPEQISRAASTQLNTAPVGNQALATLGPQTQPPIGLQAPQVVNAPAQQPSIELVQQSIAQRAAEVQEAALLRDESIQALQQELDPVTTPQDELDAPNTARLQNGLETAQQLTELNQAQLQLEIVNLAQNQLNALQNQNQPDALDPLGLNQERPGVDPLDTRSAAIQAQQDAEAAQETRAEEQRIVEEQNAEAAEEQRIVEEQNAERVAEQQDLQRTETQRLQQERDAAELLEQQDAQRAEELRVQAREQAATIQAQEEAERVVAQQEAQRLQAQRLEAQQSDQVTENAREVLRTDTDRAIAERAIDAYRIQSERAAETATARAEANLPLNDQLQAARARLDALADTSVDRVDISNSALVGLAG